MKKNRSGRREVVSIPTFAFHADAISSHGRKPSLSVYDQRRDIGDAGTVTSLAGLTTLAEGLEEQNPLAYDVAALEHYLESRT